MRTIAHFEELAQQLSDPDEAAEYLGACAFQSTEALLLGLRDVVAARGGVSELARATRLSRESLYRALSAKGNPTLSTLELIFKALGLQIAFIRRRPR